MSRNVSVTEPHPSVVRSSGYIGSGRGGAGNYKRYDLTSLSEGSKATGPASRVSLTKKPGHRMMTGGRGGAGNLFAPTETAEQIFQFDEEMIKRRESAAPMYHIGRGGAANYIDESKPRTQRIGSTDSTASIDSDRSTGSGVRRSIEGAFGRLQRKVTKP